MKRRILVFAAVSAVVFGSMGSMTVCAQEPAVSCETYAAVAPHSDNCVWRYKAINGVIYRRLYDITNQRWIGEWEACP